MAVNQALAREIGRARVLTAAEVGALDAAAVRLGAEGGRLMAAAGAAVAAETAARAGAGAIVALAGPGKNGGDGFVAALALRAQGRMVRVLALGAPKDADAAAARSAFEAAGGRVEPLSEARLAEALAAGPALVIDALFGVGLRRPLTGEAAAAAALLGRSGARVLAVDLPSGVDADTGRALGPAVAAEASVTFEAKRRGHLLGEGALLSGAVIVAPIGLPAAAWDALTGPVAVEIAGEAFAPWIAKRDPRGHKFDHGAALVVAGGFGATGAARLAARAALRVGAGLVTVAAPAAAMAECAASQTAIMLREAEDAPALAALLADPRLRAALIGPGHAAHPGGPARTRAMTLAALERGRGRTIVLDADALSAFAEAPEALFAAIRSAGAVAMTPHAGEFARLFPDLAAEARSGVGKAEAAAQAARRSGAVVLLKGFDTVVAAPDGRLAFHAAVGPRACPWLATAGAGDVLAGLATGLAARGWPAFEAAAAAAWLQLEAGRSVGPGLIAEDLPEALPGVLARLGASLGEGRPRG